MQSLYYPKKKPYGTIWDYYLTAPFFLENPNSLESVLLLGLGGGTAVKLLNKAYAIKKITGVEVDPIIIEIAKNYFDLRSERNLSIINGDALQFILNEQNKYDLIILDTFIGDEFDTKVDESVFYYKLKDTLTPIGVVLINRAGTKNQIDANLRFENLLLTIFNSVFLLKVHNNLLYFVGAGDIRETVFINNLISRRGKYEDFRFLRKFNSKSLKRLK